MGFKDPHFDVCIITTRAFHFRRVGSPLAITRSLISPGYPDFCLGGRCLNLKTIPFHQEFILVIGIFHNGPIRKLGKAILAHRFFHNSTFTRSLDGR